jgi:hypothetical protein
MTNASDKPLWPFPSDAERARAEAATLAAIGKLAAANYVLRRAGEAPRYGQGELDLGD